jgi:predicted  nucleic acid-binding Zn-ribbon protein
MSNTTAANAIEEKLRALYDLQLIDSKIDTIREARGELPKEVEDLAIEIEDMEKRISELQEEIDAVETEIGKKKMQIKDSEDHIKKYKEQLENVRNNREFEALNKEIEYQTLEIELANKRIREFQVKIANKQEFLEIANSKVAERKDDLSVKRGELDSIIADNEKEETKLQELSKDYAAKVDERLLNAYRRIRTNANNGLAVVPVIDGAIVGSFYMIPPQQVLDISARKRVMFSEHCGRILVDEALAKEEAQKLESILQHK